MSLRSKSSDKYLAAEHPSWGVATADREEIDDWEKFNVSTVHGWDTATRQIDVEVRALGFQGDFPWD